MDIGLRILILAIGLALMAGYYYLVVKPRQRHRGYTTRIRNPGMFTPKSQVPNYPQEEYDSGDVVVTRRLGPDGEEVHHNTHQHGYAQADASMGQANPSGYQEPVIDGFDTEFDFDPYESTADAASSASQPRANSAAEPPKKPKKPLKLQPDPVRTPIIDPNQRSPYDIAAEKEAAKKAELQRVSDDLLRGSGEFGSTTGSDYTTTLDDELDYDADLDMPSAPSELGLDNEADIGYDDNTAEVSAVDEMRVETSRSSRRFSQRAQKFASPERQKKKSVDSVIPDDAKGTSQGKLSYSPVSPTMGDNQLESEVDADTGAADLEKPKKMVVITLHPQSENAVFKGSEIRTLMETFSLTLSSKSGFYECMDGLAFSGKAETIFSVGHLRGTGRFERTKLPSLETSGLIFFMTIPGPVNAADAIDMMFSIGAKAAKMLNAKLCDQKKSKLTVEQMINIRDEAVSFEKALMEQNLL